MSLSFSWMMDVMEEKVSAFMDLMLEQRFTKKEDMIKAWNGMSGNMASGASQKEAIKQVETERCVFKITRGDKMGEQCPSRSKKGTLYCVKHTKDKKKEDDKKEEVSEEKEVVQSEFMTSSHRLELELKKKETVKSPVEIEFETKNIYKVVKGTPIVVNTENEVIGYLEKQQLVKGTTQKIDKQIREFQLVVNRDGWPEMDE
jgi:hypothetical protein